MTSLYLLSAGAAKGLVAALAHHLRDAGIELRATFEGVGAIRERLDAGEPCDVLILTAPMLDALASQGRIVATTIAPLGRVRTGIAVRKYGPHPAIGDRDALRQSFLNADAIFVPDTERATAGIHCLKMLKTLDIYDRLVSRLRAYPSGAQAMAALAASTALQPIGCTQITEIKYTAGVSLVGPLPPMFDLSTVYSVGVTANAQTPVVAEGFAALLHGDASRALREAGGFEIQ